MIDYCLPIKPLAVDLPLHDFIRENTVEVARQILDGAPQSATLFVYAYVAKGIDYLRIDDLGTWHVVGRSGWKPLHNMVVSSLTDIAFSLENLNIAVDALSNV